MIARVNLSQIITIIITLCHSGNVPSEDRDILESLSEQVTTLAQLQEKFMKDKEEFIEKNEKLRKELNRLESENFLLEQKIRREREKMELINTDNARAAYNLELFSERKFNHIPSSLSPPNDGGHGPTRARALSLYNVSSRSRSSSVPSVPHAPLFASANSNSNNNNNNINKAIFKAPGDHHHHPHPHPLSIPLNQNMAAAAAAASRSSPEISPRASPRASPGRSGPISPRLISPRLSLSAGGAASSSLPSRTNSYMFAASSPLRNPFDDCDGSMKKLDLPSPSKLSPQQPSPRTFQTKLKMSSLMSGSPSSASTNCTAGGISQKLKSDTPAL